MPSVLDVADFEEALRRVDEQMVEQGGLPFLRSWYERLKKGEIPFNFSTLKELIAGVFFNQLRIQSVWIGQLLVLSVICVLLEHLRQAFVSPGASRIASLVCLALIMSVTLQSITQSLQIARLAIDRMGSFMEVLVPLIMTIMLAMGHGTTVAVMQPLVLSAMSFLTLQVHHVVFPIIMIYLALSLANGLSEHQPVAQLTKFLKQIIQWGIGLTMTLFSAALAISGGFASVVDGVTLRTAKFMASNLIPVAGKIFADVLDTAAGASMLLKSSLGAIGLLVIIIIIGLPLLQILLQAMVLRLTGAILEPLGDQKTSAILAELSGVLMLIFTVLGAIGIMVIMTLAALLLAGNSALMLR